MPGRDESGGFSELIRDVERSAEPIFLTEPRSPFRIVYVNGSWTKLCGYSSQQTIGRTPAILQGSGTCRSTLRQLGEAVANGRSIRVELLNFTMHGRSFVNQLTLSPIVDERAGDIYLYKFDMLAAPAGAITVDPAGACTTVEPSAAVAAPFLARDVSATAMTGTIVALTDAVARARQETCPHRRVPRFLSALHALLCDKRFSHLASWSDDGLSFCVHQPSVFAEVVLPCFYRHNRLSSFHQQLKLYSFKRTELPHVTATISWQNPLFRRDRAELVSKLRTKQHTNARADARSDVLLAEAPSSFREVSTMATQAAQSGDCGDASRGSDKDDTSAQEAPPAECELGISLEGVRLPPPNPTRERASVGEHELRDETVERCHALGAVVNTGSPQLRGSGDASLSPSLLGGADERHNAHAYR